MPLQILQLSFTNIFAENLHAYCLGSSETVGSKIIAVQPSDGACFNSSTQYEGMTNKLILPVVDNTIYNTQPLEICTNTTKHFVYKETAPLVCKLEQKTASTTTSTVLDEWEISSHIPFTSHRVP